MTFKGFKHIANLWSKLNRPAYRNAVQNVLHGGESEILSYRKRMFIYGVPIILKPAFCRKIAALKETVKLDSFSIWLIV